MRAPRLALAPIAAHRADDAYDTDDIRRAARFGSAARRRQFLEARHLARTLLPPGFRQIAADDHGRPRVLPAGAGDLSLSHAGGWVAAALAEDGRVGIDIEVGRAGRDVALLAERFLSPAECRVVAAEGQPAFLAFWTMREAVSKLWGRGLAEALALDGSALPDGRNSLSFGQSQGHSWVMAHRQVGEVQLALAWAPPDSAAAAPAGELLWDRMAALSD